jgi:SpoVK/Ycf46/Vps4 family AAA+-type ATPase
MQRLMRACLRKKTIHRAAMLMKRLEVEAADGLLKDAELDSLRSRLCTALSTSAIGTLQAESMATVATAAAALRQQADTERTQFAKQQFERTLVHPDTEQLRIRLQWNPEQPKAYAALLVQLSQTVGLTVVKAHVREQLTDAMGRKMKGELMQMRHVIIEGDFGTGKRTAAELVARLGKVLGEVDTNCGTKAYGAGAGSPLASASIHEHNRFKTHLLEVPEPPCGKTHIEAIDNGIRPNSIYYLRVSAGSPRPKNSTDTPVLEKLASVGSVLVIAGEKKYVDEYRTALDAFRRREPHLLQLPTISATNLAKITAKLVRARGYYLQPPATLGRKLGVGSTGSTASAREGKVAVAVMTFVVRQRFNEDTIRLRNAHLAADMLDMAIARKNGRPADEADGNGTEEHESNPLTLFETLHSKAKGAFECVGAGLTLKAEDFDVTLPDRDLRDSRRREVDAEIDAMIGWGGSDVAGSPKAFFESARRIMLRQEKELADGESDQSMEQLFNWNVVVTGTPGTGKTTFARLLHRFCLAYGVCKKDTLVACNGVELKGQYVGQTGPKVAKMFEAAKGGSLFVDEAYALAGIGDASSKGRDSFSVEAVRTMLTELENHRSSVVCVLAGYADKMGRLLRADPGLQSRFPYRVHISDYTHEQLAQITQLYAEKKGFALEASLMAPSEQPDVTTETTESISMLGQHLKITYGDDKDAGNGRLAVNLVEAAIQKRAFRMDNEREQLALQKHAGQCLLAIDFDIGTSLGDEKSGLKAAVDAELEALVGMGTVKEWFKTLKNKVWLADQTGDRSALKTCMHMVITGNPGTGKTTFTRLLFRFLYAYGILTKDTFVEKNGLELKGQYIGDTAPKVIDAVAEAKGGCLFLDEAYALAGDSESGHTDSFSKEAVSTLLTEVENNRTSMMCVMAGYKDKMQRLLRMDPGLERRFRGSLHLPDYTPTELAEICVGVAKSRYDKEIASHVEEALAEHIKNYFHREISTQNGGLAVNIVEAALERQADRLAELYQAGATGADVSALRVAARTLVASDFEIEETEDVAEEEDTQSTHADTTHVSDVSVPLKKSKKLGKPAEARAIEAELEKLVGMGNAKAFFQRMKSLAQYVERGGSAQALRTSLNMVITGSPGTGKTTIARLCARYLHALGVLPRNRFIECNGLELKGQYVGQTAPKVQAAVADAMGGCLFIDEAYALAGGNRGPDSFSGEAIRMLLTELENNRGDLLVILAGYEGPMEGLMKADPGLNRRFPQGNRLLLPNYTPAEVSLITEGVAKRRFDLTLDADLRQRLPGFVAAQHGSFDRGGDGQLAQSNGGLAVNLVEQALTHLAVRVVEQDLQGEDATLLTAVDFGMAVDADAAEVEQQYQPLQPTPGMLVSTPTSTSTARGVKLGSGSPSGTTDDGRQSNDCTLSGGSRSPAPKQPIKDIPLQSNAANAPPCPPPPSRTRTRRAPPKSNTKPETLPPPVQQQPAEGNNTDAQKGNEDGGSDGDVTAEVQERLRNMGACPQSFDWDRRSRLEQGCMKCDKNAGGCGYQCKGGGHWICDVCVGAPSELDCFD